MDIVKFRRGQVWWQRNSANYIQGVTGNTRPVVIVSNDIANKYSSGITVVPLTTADKKSLPTHVGLNIQEGKDSIALCEQIKTVSAEIFTDYIGTLEETKLTEIEGAILIALGFKPADVQEEQFETKIEPVEVEFQIQEEKPIMRPSRAKAKRFSKREREMILSYLRVHTLSETAEYFSKMLDLDYKKLYARISQIKRVERSK